MMPKFTLTPRELEVLSLVREGLRDKDIAAKLGIETVTVKKHSANIKIKSGMSSKVEMVLWAIHNEKDLTFQQAKHSLMGKTLSIEQARELAEIILECTEPPATRITLTEAVAIARKNYNETSNKPKQSEPDN